MEIFQVLKYVFRSVARKDALSLSYFVVNPGGRGL